jgi:predicted DNA binding CopG/RHH family protein
VLIRSIGARSMDATVRRFHFELKPNDKLVSLFLPGQLLDPARREAKQAGMPNQPFIRLALERAVQPKAP